MAVGDLCESVDEYLQEDFFESGDTAEIVSHYLFCSGSDPLPMLTSEIQNLTRLANESLVNATREGNQTVSLMRESPLSRFLPPPSPLFFQRRSTTNKC